MYNPTLYDLLASEYYDDFHKTCRNFDMATKAALENSPMNLLEEGLVLEVGCGRGRCNEFLGIKFSRIIQLDSSRKMLAIEERETCLLRVHADAISTPFLDEQFSVIAGFLIDPFIGLCFFTEAYRLLVPGGTLLATTPTIKWGKSLRGDKEPEASLACFLTKNEKRVKVPSILIPRNKIIQMLSYCGFQSITVTGHTLPRDATPVSPDIRTAADKDKINVHELPIIDLIQALKPVS